MNLDDQVWAPDPKVGFKLGVLKVCFDQKLPTHTDCISEGHRCERCDSTH